MSSSQTSSSSSEAQVHPLAGLLDVSCMVDVVVGEGSITVRECLKLKRHSVIALRRPAGADLAVSVHGIPVASGEVIVDDDRTVVRISRITPPPGTEVPA